MEEMGGTNIESASEHAFMAEAPADSFRLQRPVLRC